MLADQWRRIGDDLTRLAANDFEICKFVAGPDAGKTAGNDHGQVAEARILRQHGEERVGDAWAETFADDDAVDVADIEMLCGGLDAERADDAHLLSERDRERRVGHAAPDQQRRRVMQRIALGKDLAGVAPVVQPAQDGRVQRAHPERRVGAGRQSREGRIGSVEGQGVVRGRRHLAHGDQRQIRLSVVRIIRQDVELIRATF